MGSLKTLALAGAVFAGATAVASAADLRYPQPVGLPPPPLAAPIAEASGWYLRGDIGIGQLNGKTELNQVDTGISRGHAEEFGSYVFGGVGVGYQYNSWLRADITGEYRGKSRFEFSDKYCYRPGTNSACSGAPVVGDQRGFNRIAGNISSMVFLANAYLDLGTWYGLTPFIGAGAGFANHKFTGGTDTGGQVTLLALAAPPAAETLGNGFATGGYLANKTKTNFAWAVMAGVGYDVSERLKLELGYRYLNMGSVTSGQSTCYGDPTCNFTVKAKNLDAHEFKLGMRWMLGGPSYAAAPAAYPVEPPRLVKKF
jgi:opacity protein-like surface antigen